MLRPLVAGAWLSMLGACLEQPPYACQRSEQCLLEGYVGTCDVASSRCVYPAAECRGMQSIQGYTDGRGNCVAAPNDQEQPGTSSSTTATASETTAEPTTDAPTTAAVSSGGTTGASDSSGEDTTSGTPTGSSETSGGSSSSSSSGGSSCDTPIGDITGYGSVSASSSLNGYGASRATDDDNTTSWFGAAGNSREFRWTSDAERCVQRIEIDDNSMHESAKFQIGYGFDEATVRVLQEDVIVFEEVVALPGSPDGNWSVDVGGLTGTRVVVEVGPFENQFAGGFSEFRVFGNPL